MCENPAGADTAPAPERRRGSGDPCRHRVGGGDDSGSSGRTPALQGTAARVLAELVASGTALSTGALAARLEMHPNGVRQHLQRLEARGLVERDREHRPRGRPRDVWRAPAEAAHALPGTAEEYRELARWLACLAERGCDELEAVGRDLGRELLGRLGARACGGDAADALTRAFAALGFAPRREGSAEPSSVPAVRLRLCRCPYADVAAAHPRLVCGLHSALTAGLAAAVAGDGATVRLLPDDPRKGRCLVEVAASN